MALYTQLKLKLGFQIKPADWDLLLRITKSKTVSGIRPITVKLRSKYAFLHLTVSLWLHLWIHLEQQQMQKQIWRINLTAFHF